MPSLLGTQAVAIRPHITVSYPTTPAVSTDPPEFSEEQVANGEAQIAASLFPQRWKPAGAEFDAGVSTLLSQATAAETTDVNGWNNTVRDPEAATVVRTNDFVLTITFTPSGYDIDFSDENVIMRRFEDLIELLPFETEIGAGSPDVVPMYTKLLPEDKPLGLRISADYMFSIESTVEPSVAVVRFQGFVRLNVGRIGKR